MIKTFKALIADGGQDTIRLSSKSGLIGYKIVKFQLIPNKPGALAAEHVVQIFKVYQDPTLISNEIDFTNQTLLAAGYVSNATSGDSSPPRQTILFDNEVFNQDIFVTHKIQNGSGSVNYYIELEQIKLDVNEAAVATLKDMRGRE